MSPHPTAMGYGKILTFSCGTDLAITLRLIQPSCFPSVDRMAHKTENKKTDVARSNTAAVSPSLFWSPESKQNHCTIANARIHASCGSCRRARVRIRFLPPQAHAFCEARADFDVWAWQPAHAIPNTLQISSGFSSIRCSGSHCPPLPRLRAALRGSFQQQSNIFCSLLSTDKFCRGEPRKELCFQLRSLQLFFTSQVWFPVVQESVQLYY